MDISELNFEEQMEVSYVNRVEGEEYLAESAVRAQAGSGERWRSGICK